MKKRAKVTPSEATAYHEAGHAIAGLALGFGVSSVEMTPDHADHAGVTRGYHTPALYKALELSGPDTYERAVRMMMCLYAGQVAEHMVTGRWNKVGSASDDDVITDVANRIVYSEEEVMALYRWVKLRTQGLLRLTHNWAAVRRVARALMEETKVSGPRVKQLRRESVLDVGQFFEAQQHLQTIPRPA